MKKTLLLASFASFAFFASAQFSKGQKVLSGSISFNQQNNPNAYTSTEQKFSSFSFSPSYAWLSSSNTLQGLKLIANIGSSKANSPSTPYNYESKNYAYGAGYFVQKIKPIGKDFFLFAELGGNVFYNEIKSKEQYVSPTESNYKGYGISSYIAPGLGYKVTSRLIADITLNNIAYINYRNGKTDYKGTTPATNTSVNSSDFSIGTGLEKNLLGNLGFGIRWLLK